MSTLTNAQNWNLVLSVDEEIEYVNDSGTDYIPITPKYLYTEAHTFLVGARSNKAKPWWFLAATLTQWLDGSPSNNPDFAQKVQVQELKRVGLNRLTLVEFKNYASPYTLVIEIPYWLEHIYLEVWVYVGP